MGNVKGKEEEADRKSWEDNIKDWTKMDFAASARVPENRTKWRHCCEFICGASRPSKVMG